MSKKHKQILVKTVSDCDNHIMSNVSKLFRHRKVYDLNGTDDLFARSMRDNALFQQKNCEDYRRILALNGFDPADIKTVDDLTDLPFIPTVYFKHHYLSSVPDKKMFIKATSSGTSGTMSMIGFDMKSLLTGVPMVLNVGRYHKLWSARPVNYIIFGYQPTKENKTAFSKTAYGFTFFAPALSRTFALTVTDKGYKLDWDNVLKAMERCAKSRFPMRTIGFPAYTYFLLRDMKAKGIRYKMPKGSMITMGGGWKSFYTEQPDKKEFYSLVEEVLGIPEDHVIEFFGAVEHPILYTDCRCHHFHVPCYSRVIIRDPDTLKPLKNGIPGLLNLISPMVRSVPIISIMTDDLAILHDEGCDCGETSPWLEIIGRVGITDIVTCAAGGEKYLKEGS